jgi:hypothetical protein
MNRAEPPKTRRVKKTHRYLFPPRDASLDFTIHIPTISIVGFKILELLQPLRVDWWQTMRLVGAWLRR